MGQSVRAAGRLSLPLFGALAGLGCIEQPVTESTLFQRAAISDLGLSSSAALPVSRPIFERIDGKTGSHAATVTALADGSLLAAWYSYDGPHELDGAAIFMSRLPAGAQEWEPPYLHIDRPEADGNPVLYSEGDSVWLFQAVVPGGWSTSHIETQTSGDGGRSWSSPRSLAGPLGANVRFPPVRAADGALILPAYDDLLKRSLFFASADGATWTLTDVVAGASPEASPIQPSVARRSGNEFAAVMRNEGRDWLWSATSSDGGRTWSAPARTEFPNPGSPAALVRLQSGKHVLVFNDSRDRRSPLSVAISSDQAQTWSAARPIASGDGRYDYPSVAQTADGLIHILYSHDREYIRHVTISEDWIDLH